MSAAPLLLVVGTGSIARRHLANLRTLFPSVRLACVSASGRVLAPGELGEGVALFDSLEAALSQAPRFAIVASPAPLHPAQAAFLLAANVPVLVEKPLADSLATVRPALPLLQANRARIGIGYNLRFMPSAAAIKACLDDGRLGRVNGVSVEAGQYLPDWRPGSDYRAGVSARPELGGGALLELSHELDYLLWLFGSFSRAWCVARNSGMLGVAVEDCVDALLVQEGGLAARLHLDLLQRRAFRRCRVIGEQGTLEWDLLANRLVLFGPAGREDILCDAPDWDRNAMYLAELAHFERVVAGADTPAVGLDQGLAVLGLVEALRHSAATGAVATIGEFCA